MPTDAPDVDSVLAGLEHHGYLADRGLATATFLALQLERPLLLEGLAGVGKTALALALSTWTGGELIRVPCYEGIDVTQAVYEWDHARQLLHLRAAEAAGTLVGGDPSAIEDELYTERFLVRRPILRALGAQSPTPPPVLLIDEIDRADDEFEALLLEVLADHAVTIPELGTIRAETPPIVVITSNRTREIHDALKRRCLYHWVDHPDLAREIAIVRLQAPQASAELARTMALAVAEVRGLGVYKLPGVAETVDWTRALVKLGVDRPGPDVLDATLGVVVKSREDQERVREHGIDILAEAIAGG